MELDPFVLSRIQFAANITFHILFPTITIGLGWFLLFFRVRYTQTGNMYWEHAYNFWVKVYALTFALGVNSLALHRHRGRSSDPPATQAAA